jgi:hypothetical protein
VIRYEGDLMRCRLIESDIRSFKNRNRLEKKSTSNRIENEFREKIDIEWKSIVLIVYKHFFNLEIISLSTRNLGD